MGVARCVVARVDVGDDVQVDHVLHEVAALRDLCENVDEVPVHVGPVQPVQMDVCEPGLASSPSSKLRPLLGVPPGYTRLGGCEIWSSVRGRIWSGVGDVLRRARTGGKNPSVRRAREGSSP